MSKKLPHNNKRKIKSVNGVLNHDELYSNYGERYLHTYFKKIDLDEKKIINFISKEYSKIENGSTFLDIGCGPGIQHVLPVTPYVSKIEMADYLKDNLKEIENWKKGKADPLLWTPFIKFTLEKEGFKVNQELINKREQELRKKITGFSKVDVIHPIKLNKKSYKAVGFFYCAEAAATNKKMWSKCIENVCKLVAPEGMLFMSSCRNSKFYVVKNLNGDEEKIPVACVNENDFKKILPKLGFDMKKTIIKVVKVGMDKHGISEVVLVSAKKNKI